MTLPPITDEDRQFLHYNPNTDDIVRWVQAYATAAVLAEREACAKVCEDLDAFCEDDPGSSAAAAIRARATD